MEGPYYIDLIGPFLHLVASEISVLVDVCGPSIGSIQLPKSLHGSLKCCFLTRICLQQASGSTSMDICSSETGARV